MVKFWCVWMFLMWFIDKFFKDRIIKSGCEMQVFDIKFVLNLCIFYWYCFIPKFCHLWHYFNFIYALKPQYRSILPVLHRFKIINPAKNKKASMKNSQKQKYFETTKKLPTKIITVYEPRNMTEVTFAVCTHIWRWKTTTIFHMLENRERKELKISVQSMKLSNYSV